MKNLQFSFSLLVSVLCLLIGCSTTKGSSAQPVNTAVVSQSVVVGDDWWNNPPQDTSEVHYEVGLAKGSTIQSSREWAKANANQNLAQYVNNAVDAVRTTYLNDAGTSADMQALQVFESLGKERAQAVLTGVTYKYYTEKDGTVYVLASLPIGVVGEKLKETVKEAFVRSPAAVKANEMMDSAIDKYFNNQGNASSISK